MAYYKKINSKGEVAPNGYHYMHDDTLMSDEEHERIFGVPFTSVSRICDVDSKPEAHGISIPNSNDEDGLHLWWICATHTIVGPIPPGTPLPITFPAPSTAGMPGIVTQYPINGYTAPFTFWGNPLLGTTNNPILQPGPNFGYNLFYDWVVQEVGPINIGDKIEFDMSPVQAQWPLPWGAGTPSNPNQTHPHSATCASDLLGHNPPHGTAINKLCLEYVGFLHGTWPAMANPQNLQNPPWTFTNSIGGGMPFSTNIMTATVTLNGCDCKYFGLGKPNGFDCEIVSYNSKPPYNPNYSCVQKYHPQVGQYATQQDCINDGCKTSPTPTDPVPTDPTPTAPIETIPPTDSVPTVPVERTPPTSGNTY